MKSYSVLAFVIALSAGTAFADTLKTDWMPVEQVKQKLMSSGYTSITKIEPDDGHWEGEGVKDGQKMKFEADPTTGEILGEMLD